nr:MAG TPA: hypothetical protein [Caudoviricetes sp.]
MLYIEGGIGEISGGLSPIVPHEPFLISSHVQR